MKPVNSPMLIPRNNWDYGLKALVTALSCITDQTSQPRNMESIFKRPVVWTTSGRTSLFTILSALELPTGAKVGVPLFCCSVVFNAIRQAGFTPCFIDSGVDDYNISVDDFRKKRADLAAVVVVHMFGNPCGMDAVNAIAGKLPVIEDCAQSMFSSYKGTRTGLLSTASFFSFRCGKYISAGEGSAILCQDEALHTRVKRLAASFAGWSPSRMLINAISTFIKAVLYSRPWYGLIGYPVGMRLDKKLNLTAKDGFETMQIAASHLALIESRLSGFEKQIERQRKHSQLLRDSLLPGVFSFLPGDSGNAFQFALCFQNSTQRNDMADFLFEHGIDTAKYLDTITEEARADYGYTGDCPNAERLAKTTLLVPIYYTLHERDIVYIADAINAFSRKF